MSVKTFYKRLTMKQCERCGHVVHDLSGRIEFCPHCSARLEGEFVELPDESSRAIQPSVRSSGSREPTREELEMCM